MENFYLYQIIYRVQVKPNHIGALIQLLINNFCGAYKFLPIYLFINISYRVLQNRYQLMETPITKQY